MKLASQPREILSLIHVITRFGECHAETQALRGFHQRIKGAASSHPLRIKQPGLRGLTTYEVVTAVSSRTQYHVRSVQKPESLIERLRRQLRAISIESNHTAISPVDKDAKRRGEASGESFALLSDDFDRWEPT